jgi:hypothetical protein
MMKYMIMRVLGMAVSLMLTPYAYAVSAPVAITNNVTGITQSSATLWGIVDAQGAATVFWFEYGTNSALGNRATMESLPNANRATVSAQLSGLQANTTYYYRVVAQNSLGTAIGDVEKFESGWKSTSAITSSNGITSLFGAPASSRTTTSTPKATAPASTNKPQTASVTGTTGVVAGVATSTATSAVASANRGSFFANIWSTITNIPGYIWFFVILLLAILFVTYTFFRMLRGRASGEDDHGDHHGEVSHEEH